MNPGDKIEGLVGKEVKLAGDPDFTRAIRKALAGVVIVAAGLAAPFGQVAGHSAQSSHEQGHAAAMQVARANVLEAKSDNGRAQAKFQANRSFDITVDHALAGKLGLSYDAVLGQVTIETGGQKKVFDAQAMRSLGQGDYMALKQDMTEKAIDAGRMSPLDDYAIDGGRNFDVFVYQDGKIMVQDRGMKEGDTASYFLFDPAQKHFSMEKYGVRDKTGHVAEDAKLGETVLVQDLASTAPQARQTLKR